MRRGKKAGYPIFSDRTRVNTNLNKATAEGDLMGFRGILCLFWAQSKARPQRGTGKDGPRQRQMDGANETEDADPSPSMQGLENLRFERAALWGNHVRDYCVPDLSICTEAKKKKRKRQTNTLRCQTSKMLCIISWERIRWMIIHEVKKKDS